jgi:hypothetical protein
MKLFFLDGLILGALFSLSGKGEKQMAGIKTRKI